MIHPTKGVSLQWAAMLDLSSKLITDMGIPVSGPLSHSKGGSNHQERGSRRAPKPRPGDSMAGARHPSLQTVEGAAFHMEGVRSVRRTS
jgi:hypothetical protein